MAVVSEFLTEFLFALDKDRKRDVILEGIREKSLAAGVPVIRDETASLLLCLVRALNPPRILEIGTGTGYSAMLMASAMKMKDNNAEGKGEIITIERDALKVREAREQFSAYYYGKHISVVEGDAGEIISDLANEEEKFNFIFLDAAKGQYSLWLPSLISMLPAGGMLFSDNVLQGGSVASSRLALPRRQRTIHKRMREFLYDLKHRYDIESAILTVGDGIAISVKK